MSGVKSKRKPEPRVREPREVTLLELLAAVEEASQTDTEAAATLQFMLRSGHVRFLDREAIAA